MKFRQREIGNTSVAIIEGRDWEHIKSNRFFTTYTYDKKFNVVLGDEEDRTWKDKLPVFIIAVGETTDMRMVIGWVYDE